TSGSFADAATAEPSLEGAATDEPIGEAPPRDRRKGERELERAQDAREASRGRPGGRRGWPGRPGWPGHPPVTPDPLSALQWDMDMIGATPDGSYAVTQGSHDVRVGIIDTGIDGSHPDIAPNF